MIFRAICQCGGLTVWSEVPPDLSVVCCCRACQRRTGSAFGVGAYFPKHKMRIEGSANSWTRATASGRSLTNYFCPVCGTTVYWLFDMRPEHVGVAVGCLMEPVEEPLRTVWAESAPDWMRFPDHWPVYDQALPSL